MRLLPFTTYTMPDYVTNWHHERLAEALDRVARSLSRRLTIFMPPQHGKSELVSRRFPAFMLGRNPDLRLICASHTSDLAVSMNRDVQRIMGSGLYADVFPETALGRPAPSLEDDPAGRGCLFGAASRELTAAAAAGAAGSSPAARSTISSCPAIVAACDRSAWAVRSVATRPTA